MSAARKIHSDSDATRALNLGRRVVDGLRTLDQEGRKAVLEAIRGEFCTSCGAATPAALCACHMGSGK